LQKKSAVRPVLTASFQESKEAATVECKSGGNWHTCGFEQGRHYIDVREDAVAGGAGQCMKKGERIPPSWTSCFFPRVGPTQRTLSGPLSHMKITVVLAATPALQGGSSGVRRRESIIGGAEACPAAAFSNSLIRSKSSWFHPRRVKRMKRIGDRKRDFDAGSFAVRLYTRASISPASALGILFARSISLPSWRLPPPLFYAPGSQFFFQGILRDPFCQHRIRQHLFQLRVLSLQLLQLLGFVHLHVRELFLPTVNRHVRDVLLPADFHDAFPCVRFPYDADLVLRAIAFSFHSLNSFLLAQTDSSSGSNFRIHVKVCRRVWRPFAHSLTWPPPLATDFIQITLRGVGFARSRFKPL
jgi:hypothetical protein